MPRLGSQKVTLEEVQKAWVENIPNAEQRKQVASIISDVFERAHAVSPGTWMISYRPGPRAFNVNVGRIFTISVKPETLTVVLDTNILPEEDFPEHWKMRKGEGRFKVIPEATWRRAPLHEVLEAWDVLEPAFIAAVEKGIRTASISPWAKFHNEDAIVTIENELGRQLPRPVHPSVNTGSADELVDLVQDFAALYPNSEEGKTHTERYLKSRQCFRDAFEEIKRKRGAGGDIVDDVLDRLLPYADTPYTRSREVWRTVAPVITRDIKQWFEGAGWVESKNWPTIARMILDFFEKCEADPGNLEEACQTFSDQVPGKGFQGAILSPGLMAINSDDFSLINKKPLYTLHHFGGLKTDSKLTSYPQANQAMLELSELVSGPLLEAEGLEDMSAVERFDMFTHWLVAVRKWRPGGVRYWKIAPGEQGWNWDTCREQGIITIGWEKLGDVGELSLEDFNDVAENMEKKHADYKTTGTKQVWTFAQEIQPGDRIVANQGKSRVLGIGTVEGTYEYVPDEVHGHHLPVTWDHVEPFDVPAHGWGKTIVSLSEKKFKKIVELSEGETNPETTRNYWLFQANPKIFNLAEEIQAKGSGILDRWRTTRYKDEIRDGDKALLWQAGKLAGVYGVAEVVGSPTKATPEDVAADSYLHEKDWFTPIRITDVLEAPITKAEFLEHPVLSQTQVVRSPQGTNFKVSEEEWEAFESLLIRDPDEPVEENEDVPLEYISSETGLDVAELDRWIRAIERKKQAVIYGPPGTGKTFIAEFIANHLIGGGDGFHQLIQFHPAYNYEDFIQGLRPEARDDGGLHFRLVPGRFIEFCDEAKKRDGVCVLILDEINRANLARVFGELMYLLEYRDKAIPLAGGRNLRIPENVRIIGTMNTADRSIALVDHALRRRFAFIGLGPKFEVLKRYQDAQEYDAGPLIDVLKRLNKAINDSNYEVGISFFMKEELQAHLPDIWQMEIEPYLEEYFFDQPKKLEEFSWDKIEGDIA